MIYSLVVLLELKVSQANVVLKLRVIRIYLFSFLKSSYRILIVFHLIETHTQIEEPLI